MKCSCTSYEHLIKFYLDCVYTESYVFIFFLQVTVNPDGTIAGAQGLNLTDGTGRMIPVNLSVSLPVTNLVEDTTETTNEKVEQYKVPVPDTVSSELVIQDTTDTAEASNNGPDKVLRSSESLLLFLVFLAREYLESMKRFSTKVYVSFRYNI